METSCRKKTWEKPNAKFWTERVLIGFTKKSAYVELERDDIRSLKALDEIIIQDELVPRERKNLPPVTMTD